MVENVPIKIGFRYNVNPFVTLKFQIIKLYQTFLLTTIPDPK